MTKPIKILIVEDEMVTATNMQNTLEDAGYCVAGIADEAEKALLLIGETEPDLAILDIQLIGEKDGIWIAEQINKKYKIPFIFLTSFGDKNSIAMAVRTRPFGYLLKPFDETDVLESIQNALQNFSVNREAEMPKQNAEKKEVEESLVIKEAIFVRHNNIYMKVNFSDILFIQADKNYMDIITETKKYTVRTSLKEMLTTLPKMQFVQINKSCIINLQKFDGYGRDVVIVKQHELSLSENFKDEFMKYIRTQKD